MDDRLKQFGRRALWGALLAVFFYWLATRPPTHGQVVVEESLALGTLVSLSVYLDDSGRGEALAALWPQLDADLTAYEARWSVLSDGALSAVNSALADGETASIPESLAPLFTEAARLSQASGGHFDVRVGALVDLWQWNRQEAFATKPPDDAAIDAAVAAIAAAPPLSAAKYGPAEGISLNFGGIAKGDAAALISRQLLDAGFAHHLVNMGGDVVSAGGKGGAPWRIGVRHPRPPDADQPLMGIIETTGGDALFTSGDYERYFEFEGQRYHHLLDPVTGRPARGLVSATVIADDAVAADAASTALFVAGPDHWRQTARDMNIEAAMVMHADGRLQATHAFARRFQPSRGIEVETVP